MTDDQFKELVELLAEKMALDELAETYCIGQDAKQRLARAKETKNQDWLRVRYAALSACSNLRALGYLQYPAQPRTT